MFLELKNNIPDKKFRRELLNLDRTYDQVKYYIQCYQHVSAVRPPRHVVENKGQKLQLVETNELIPPKEYVRCEACGEERLSGTAHACTSPGGKWETSQRCPLCRGTGRVSS